MLCVGSIPPLKVFLQGLIGSYWTLLVSSQRLYEALAGSAGFTGFYEVWVGMRILLLLLMGFTGPFTALSRAS